MSSRGSRTPAARGALLLAAVLVLLAAAPSAAHAEFGLTKLRLGGSGTPERYTFAPGETIVGEGTVDANRHYQAVVYDPSGQLWYTGTCVDTDDGGTGMAVAYIIPLTDPPSGGSAWRVELRQYTSSMCATPEKTDSLYYTLASATTYADPSMSQPAPTLPAGATAYVKVAGLGQVKESATVEAENDWRVRWLKPSGVTACENREHPDRPESSASGALPGPPGSFLQYPPDPGDGGDPWNRQSHYETGPCPALTLADRGTWRVRLERGANHVVTLPAFTVDDAPLPPTIDGAPPSPGNDHTPTWSFSAAGAERFECRLERGTEVISAWAACSSPHTYDLTAAPDGSYRFSVRGISSSGAAGAVTTSDYQLDTAAPAPPTIVSRPSSPGNDATPEWSFSGSGGTFECRLESESGVVADWSACTSPATFDLSAEPDGTYAFSVRERSASGAEGAATADEYSLDTTGPAVLIGSQPASPGNDPTPEWEFSAEPGASFECRLERDATVVADWSACSSPSAYDLAAEPDGAYRFAVRATDAAQNTGPAVASDYVLDSSAPPPPAIDAAPASPGTDRTPEWAFSGATGATFECRLERGSTVVSDWTGCASPRTFDLSAEPDGDYRFAVRAVSAAGNTGGAATSDYTLDTTPPVAPTITFSPGAVGSNPDPMWYFEGAPGERLECRLARGATVISDWTACASPQDYDLASEPDGSYTFSVRGIDEAGNAGPARTSDYSLDREPPGAPTITFGPGAGGSNSAPQWSFAGQTGETFECRLDRGTEVVSDWAECTSPQDYDLGDEADGGYRFSVRAVDAAGNAGDAVSADYELDTTGPAAPAIDSAPPAAGSGRTPEWTFSSESGASFECRLQLADATVANWAACSSPHGYDLADMPDGAYVFAVRAIDTAGNVGQAATSGYELDTTAPDAPAIDSAPATPGSDRLPGWRFSGEAGAELECRLDRGAAVASDWAACSSPHGYDLAGEADGPFTFRVRAVDAAGNTGAAATSAYELDTTAPSAPAIDSGPPSPGNDVSPEWSFSGEPGVDLECRFESGGAPVADWAGCSSPHAYDLSGLSDGAYDFAVRAVDTAGNVSGATAAGYELDTTGPSATIDSAPPSPGSATGVSWSFSAPEPASFECALFSGSTAVRAPEPCASPIAFDLTGMADGVYTFQVRAADALGNAGSAVTSGYELRIAAPPPEPPPSEPPPSEPPPTVPATAPPPATDSGPVSEPEPEPEPPPAPPKSQDERDPDRDREPSPRRDRAPDAERDRQPSAAPPAPSPPSSSPPAAALPAPAPPAAPADLDDPVPPLGEPAAGASGRPGGGDGRSRPDRAARDTPAPARGRSASKGVRRLLERAGITGFGAAPSEEREGESPMSAAFDTAGHVVKAALERPETAGFPALLLLMVGGFLVVQNRIDRNDPKLALAPVFADSDLEFELPPTL